MLLTDRACTHNILWVCRRIAEITNKNTLLNEAYRREQKPMWNYYEANRTNMFANNQHTNRLNRFAPLFSQLSKNTLISIQRDKKPSPFIRFFSPHRLTFLFNQIRQMRFLFGHNHFYIFQHFCLFFLSFWNNKKCQVSTIRKQKKKTITSCVSLVCIKVEEICWI